MANSKVEIANLALMHVGDNVITSFSDGTAAANTINTVYETIRDAVLRDHIWNFAVKQATPSLDATTPIYGFNHRFDMPTDLLRLIEIEDNPNPINIKYVYKNETVTEYDSMFVQALAVRLAATIAERLTQSSTLAEELLSVYRLHLKDAKSVDAQANYPDDLEANLWLDSRVKGTSIGSGDL
jgi:hypothetical protein